MKRLMLFLVLGLAVDSARCAVESGVVWACATYLHVPGGDFQVCSTITYL